MATFKIGDIVTTNCLVGNKGIRNSQGKVIGLNNTYVNIEFNYDIGGHSCNNKGKNRYCWNLNIANITLVNPISIEPEYDVY